MLGNNRDYKTADRRARKQLRIHAENMKQLMELGHSKEHASRIALQMMERKHDPNYEYPVGWPYPFCQECYQVHEGIKGDGQEREIKNNSNQQEEPTMKTEEKKAGHTEGKLHVGMKPGPILYGEKGEAVADCRLETNFNDENRANARRLKAAWNDCDSIPTEALENGVVGEMREALEMLTPLDHHITCSGLNFIVGSEEREQYCTCGAAKARAAMRKLKGEQP